MFSKIFKYIAGSIEVAGYIAIIFLSGFNFLETVAHFLRYNVWKTKSVLQLLSDADRVVLASKWKGIYSVLEGIPTFLWYWFMGGIYLYFWYRFWKAVREDLKESRENDKVKKMVTSPEDDKQNGTR